MSTPHPKNITAPCPRCDNPVSIDSTKCNNCGRTFDKDELRKIRDLKNASYKDFQYPSAQKNQTNLIIVSVILFFVFLCGILIITDRPDPEGDMKWERDRMLENMGYPRNNRR
jgi:uncharacterized membrane protein YvbJ